MQVLNIVGNVADAPPVRRFEQTRSGRNYSRVSPVLHNNRIQRTNRDLTFYFLVVAFVYAISLR